ncbi:CPBP family intramembrane metalloprotease [Xanthomonas campestris pv. badrii]|uniref:CPBP family intramembrane metalloprotease n=1 Tax=Xanthomonas campestris pv. badrii TaxID=149696 RepID=A0A7Z2VBE2_XANCA|nr:CPBP family intramembrane glutamic endopeptidase [Xanthomonas campestris]MCC4605127.1 CPBP family intramembrane metalloprotease [Xanthomonas campestris pv. parthenii]QJD68343.1 CPBP family intramembrane metalloprotease [Xanthomonas campestris pv. badrii]
MDARADLTRSDFPFYNRQPIPISALQWLLILSALCTAFALLIMPWPSSDSIAGRWVHPLLFCLVPLGAMTLISGRAVAALFHRLRVRDGLWMIAIAALNLAVTVLVALAFSGQHRASSNPLFAQLGGADLSTRILAFGMMAPQLLGEELLTVLPLLALLQWFTARVRMRRSHAVLCAWLLSALPFALAHLPTYQWDLLQCLVIIGTARLVLSLAYLTTRNLWVSTGAHLLNDWALFGFALSYPVASMLGGLT